jgi:hypothetical protein
LIFAFLNRCNTRDSFKYGVEHSDTLVQKDAVGDVEHLCAKEGPEVIHINKVHPVGEGINVELLEEGQIRRINPVTLLGKVGVVGCLNLPAGDLGLGLYGLE